MGRHSQEEATSFFLSQIRDHWQQKHNVDTSFDEEASDNLIDENTAVEVCIDLFRNSSPSIGEFQLLQPYLLICYIVFVCV